MHCNLRKYGVARDRGCHASLIAEAVFKDTLVKKIVRSIEYISNIDFKQTVIT